MSYLTDLTEKQKDLMTAIIGDDMPIMRKYCVFDILKAIFYVVRTGCQWSMLPKCFPNWRLVYHHFRSWVDCNWFAQVQELLVCLTREANDRKPRPTTAIVDSQSVRLPVKVKSYPRLDVSLAHFALLIGHNARIAPSSQNKIHSRIRRSCVNIFCWMESKNPELRKYFNSLFWYMPDPRYKGEPDSFTDIEKDYVSGKYMQ